MKNQELLVRSFREIQAKFPRYYSALLAQMDLTLPQFTLLVQLNQAGQLSMSEVGSRIYVSKPAVTSLVDRLEKKRLLARLPHPTDRRVYLLEIRPKGKAAVQQIQSQALKLLLDAYVRFNSAEKKIVSEFYSVISKKLDEALSRIKR